MTHKIISVKHSCSSNNRT